MSGRSGDRFAGHDPRRGRDTAGVPWTGRTLAGTGFDDDTGAADAGLVAALTDPADEVRLVAAVARARLLVPVVAVPGEVDDSSGLARDVSSDMAAVTLTAPDGTRALPAFTCLASLAAWDVGARPVPVPAQRAAQAAIQEGCQVIVLDLPPAGTGARPAYLLRGSMVWALAMRRRWLAAHEDPQVAGAVDAAVRVEPAVLGHTLAAGPGGALQVGLTLRTGLDQPALQALVTRVGERIAADGEIRARIDAVSFALHAAGRPRGE